MAVAPDALKIRPRTQMLRLPHRRRLTFPKADPSLRSRAAHGFREGFDLSRLPVDVLGALGLRRKLVAALGSPRFEHLAATFSRHSLAKAVDSLAMSFLGLERAFRHYLLRSSMIAIAKRRA